MLALVSEGYASPSADAVALRAGVGLRSVFRHFSDMDSLYREMSGAIETGLSSIVAAPVPGADWRAQLDEIMKRRARAFEQFGPFLRAARANRHRSSTLDEDYLRLSRRSRENLERVLSAGDKVEALDALDLLLSFETWLRLRDDQGLSVGATGTLVRNLVLSALGANLPKRE